MHKLLERQLRRQFGSLENVPAALRPLIDAVDASYESADEDRRLVERSLELMSSELLQANADLRQKQREQRAIFDSVPAMIIYKDTENRILRLNEMAAKALGGTAKELEGKHTAELLPAVVADALHKDDLEVIKSGRSKLGIVESHPTPDGRQHWLRTDKVPYVDDAGKVIGVVVLSVDITQRKEAEDALRASEEKLRLAYGRLQQLDRERTQFINNAAHELGTPLTPIKLQIHAVKQRFAMGHDVEQVHAMQVLERNFERLGELVKDLLDSARIQADNLRLAPQPIDLGDVVSHAVETYAGAARAAGLTLTRDRCPPLVVRADVLRTGQVMENLLSNAMKFTPPGGQIHVSCRSQDGFAVISVTDNGMGIRGVDLAKLFQPFSQVHDVMEHTVGGTGLGLYISKGIVESHGGTISAESDGPGKGASFRFRIPLVAQVDAPQRPGDSPDASPDDVPVAV